MCFSLKTQTADNNTHSPNLTLDLRLNMSEGTGGTKENLLYLVYILSLDAMHEFCMSNCIGAQDL